MPYPALGREDRLAIIERRLLQSEQLLSSLVRSGRLDASAHARLDRRIASAREQLDRLRQTASSSELEDVADHLARWIGNRDTPPTPRRLPPLPIGDPRRRD